MADKSIPDPRLEPWHAVFTDSKGAYREATKYGDLLVENGLARNYYILTLPRAGNIEIHCIPYSVGGKNMLHYWNKLVDNNV